LTLLTGFLSYKIVTYKQDAVNKIAIVDTIHIVDTTYYDSIRYTYVFDTLNLSNNKNLYDTKIPTIYNKKESNHQLFWYKFRILTSIFLISFAIFYLVFYLFRRYISKDIALIKFRYIIRRLNPFVYFRILETIFKFQELVDELVLQSQQQYIEVNSLKLRRKVAEILLGVKYSIDLLTGSDLTIQILLFESTNMSDSTTENSYAVFFERIISRIEREQIIQEKIKSRNNNTKILLTTAGISDSIDSIETDSAYEYVFKNGTYWISNDLTKDLFENRYKTSVKDWDNYYLCNAIFPLNNESHKTPIGLICIDSKTKNIFDNLYLPQLMKHFAGRLYYPLRNIYELSKKQTYTD